MCAALRMSWEPFWRHSKKHDFKISELALRGAGRERVSGAAHNVAHRPCLPVSHNFCHKELWEKLWKTLDNVVDSSCLVLGGVAPPAYRYQHTHTVQTPGYPVL